MGGQHIQNADGVAVRRWATAIIVRTPWGAVSMSHLPIWLPTTSTIGWCARRFCSHGTPGSSGTLVDVVASHTEKNKGSAVL